MEEIRAAVQHGWLRPGRSPQVMSRTGTPSAPIDDEDCARIAHAVVVVFLCDFMSFHGYGIPLFVVWDHKLVMHYY